MLTRAKLKRGEGQLEALKQEMSSPRKLGPYASEDDFFEAFKLMQAMVEEIYHERGQRRNPKVEEGESSVRARRRSWRWWTFGTFFSFILII
jgi:hypothetical protein